MTNPILHFSSNQSLANPLPSTSDVEALIDSNVLAAVPTFDNATAYVTGNIVIYLGIYYIAPVNIGSGGGTPLANTTWRQIPTWGSYTTTASAAGTFTMDLYSAEVQRISGTTTHTYTLPVASTLPALGKPFLFINDSTGTVTVNSSGGNAVATILTGQRYLINNILLSGTTAASWTVTSLTDSSLTAGTAYGWVGSTLDSFTETVTSNGTTITLTFEKSGTGDVRVIFSTGIVTIDSSPALTIALTAGTATVPVENWVYILASAPTVLTKSTTGFPTTEEYFPIGRYVCSTAALTQTYGLQKAHKYTNDVNNGTENGHISHLSYWVRNQPATWVSGCALTPTLTAASPDTLTFAIATGTVLQMHQHTFPAFNSATVGSTYATTFFVANHTTAYTAGKDLYNFKLTSGGAAAGNNDRISWVIWAVQSQSSGDCKVYVNLPSGFYTSDALAIADGSRYANYSIPTAYKGTAFLVAKLTYKYNTSGGGDLTLVENLDLRGLNPTTSPGGTTATPTEFLDSSFVVEDEADSTKKVVFDIGSATTGVTTTFKTAATSNATHTFPTTTSTIARIDAAQSFTGTQTFNNYLQLSEDGGILMDQTLSADGKFSIAVGEVGTLGETLSFGHLVYFKAADSRWWKCDSDAEATSGPVKLGIVCVAGNAGDDCQIMLNGKIRADSLFPTFTVGAPVHIGATAGEMVVTAPTSGIVRIVGYGNTADSLYFNPDAYYEERGSWTPTITALTGSFTTTTLSSATYIKQSKLVNIRSRFGVTTIGTAADGYNLANMPFTGVSGYFTTMSGYNVSSDATYNGYVENAGTSMRFLCTITNTHTYANNGAYYT